VVFINNDENCDVPADEVIAADADIPDPNEHVADGYNTTPAAVEPIFNRPENVVPVRDPHDWSVVFTSNMVIRPSSVAISAVFVAIAAFCVTWTASLLTI
jgi:hypothetical protein